jgi:esterase/lipase
LLALVSIILKYLFKTIFVPPNIIYSSKWVKNMNLKDMVKYDKNYPFDIQEIEKSTLFEYGEIKELSLDNSIGGRVTFSLVIPKYGESHSGIEFIHWLETEAEDSNRTQFLSHAKELAKYGYTSILPDGFWSTTPEKFKKNPKLWWKTEYEFDKNLCVTQIINLLRVHDYFTSLDNVNSNKIALVGHDFGAMFGCLLINFVKTYKAFVLIAATTRFHHWFRFGSKLSEEELKDYGEKMSTFDPINYISSMTPNPILMQFALDDFFVPKEVAKNYYSSANDPKELLWYEAKHGMIEQTFTDMKNWIKKSL